MSRAENVIIFNGEIYNYRELRAELEARGVRLTSQSDTEVLLQSYLQWGSAAWVVSTACSTSTNGSAGTMSASSDAEAG